MESQMSHSGKWESVSTVKSLVAGFYVRHTGLLVSTLAVVLSFLLFFGNSLDALDDYLTAMIFQFGFDVPMERSDIAIVKKDQRTSELLGENPGRPEFASIFRFLGSPHRIEKPSKGKKASYKGIELKFGLLPCKVGSVVKWSLGFDPPSPETATSLFTFSENAIGVLKTFDCPIEPEALASFTRCLDALSPGSSGELPGEFQDRWAEFLTGLVNSWAEVGFRFFPSDGVALAIGITFVKPAPPSGYLVPPAHAVAFDFVLQGHKTRDEDELLVSGIGNASCPVILAGYMAQEEFHFTEQSVREGRPTEQAVSNKTALVSRKILPAPIFTQGTHAQVGMINIQAGHKALVTQIPLFVVNTGEKRLEPAFSLLAALHALDAVRASAGPAGGSYVEALKPELDRIYDAMESGSYAGGINVLDRFIPTDPNGNMVVKFVGSTSKGRKPRFAFPSYSFYECFDELHLASISMAMPERTLDFDPNKAHARTLEINKHFGGRTCFIGPFELSDMDQYPTPLSFSSHFTPQSEPLMGIEIHANAFCNIVDNTFLRPPQRRMTLALMICSTLILGAFLDVVSPITGAFLAILGLAGVTAFSFQSYHAWGQVFLIAPFVVSFPSAWAMTTLVNYLRQRERANTTKAMFSRFVAGDVVQYMIDHPNEVRPGGQKIPLTIFFSDVAGFTTISEMLSPEELVILMNEYLGAMTDLLFTHGGTLDKYIGDAVMAFWNCPRRQVDHAVRACTCALDMQKKIKELQIMWAKRGLPKVYARAGINTAEVVVGFMGASDRMNYTCLGDGVNLASRLEGANKEYGTLLMISDATYQLAKDHVTARFLDFLAVKGKKEPVKVNELISLKGQEPPHWAELAPLYDQAIKLHLDRKWDEAIATFELILTKWPDDGPSKTYLKRCHEYKEAPPPENWDGSYHLTHK